MADEFVAPNRTNEDHRKTIGSVLLINESSLQESPNDSGKSDELDREKTVSPSLEIAEECIQSFIHQGLETAGHEHQSSTNLLSNTYSRSGLEIHGTSTVENINKEESFISNPVEQLKALGIEGMSESEEKQLKEETLKAVLEAKRIIDTQLLDASNVDDRLSISADDDVMDNSEKELYAKGKAKGARGGKNVGDNLTSAITETCDKVGSKVTCDFDKQDMEVTEKMEKEKCDIDNNGKSRVDDDKKRKKHKHHKKHSKKKKKKYKKEKKAEKEKGKDFKREEEEEESGEDDSRNLDDQVFETDSKLFSKRAEAAAASKESLKQKYPYKRKLLSVVACMPSDNKTSLTSKESKSGLHKDEPGLVWHAGLSKVHYPRRKSSDRSSNSSESIKDGLKDGLARRRKSSSTSRMGEDRDQTGKDGASFRSERTLEKGKRDVKKKRRRSFEEESMELPGSTLKRKKRDSSGKEKKKLARHPEGTAETSRSNHPQKSRKSPSRSKKSEDRRMSRSESSDSDRYPRKQERSRSGSSDRQRSGSRTKDRSRKHSQISRSKKSRSKSRDRPLKDLSDRSRSRSKDRPSKSKSKNQVSRDLSDRSRSRSKDRRSPSRSKSKYQVSKDISDRSRRRSKGRPSKNKSKDQVSRDLSDRSRSRSKDRSPSRSKSKYQVSKDLSDRSRSRSKDRPSPSRSKSKYQVSRDLSDRSRSRSKDRPSPSRSKSKYQVSRDLSDRSRSRSKDRPSPSRSKSKYQVSRDLSDRSRSRSKDRPSPSRSKSKYQVSKDLSDRSRSRSKDRPSPSRSKSKYQVSRDLSDRSRSRSKDRRSPSRSKSKDQVSKDISDRSRSRSKDRRSSSSSTDQLSRSRSRSKDRSSKTKRKSQGQPSKVLKRSKSGSVDQQSKVIKSKDLQKPINKSEVKSIRDRSRSRSEEKQPAVSRKSREKSQDEAPVRMKDKAISRKEAKKRWSTSTESRSRSKSPSPPKPIKTKEKKKKKKSKLVKTISLSGESVDKDQESHTIECPSKDKPPVNVEPIAPSRKRSLSRSASRERSPKRHVQTSPKVLSEDTTVKRSLSRSTSRERSPKRHVQTSPKVLSEDTTVNTSSKDGSISVLTVTAIPAIAVEDKELTEVSEKQSLDTSPTRERSPEKCLDKATDDGADIRLEKTTEEEHGKEELKEEIVAEFVAEEDTRKGDVEESEPMEKSVEPSTDIPKTDDVKEVSGEISEETGTARDEIDSSSKEKDSISSSLDTKHDEEVVNAEAKDQQNKEAKEFKDETLEGNNMDIVTPEKNSQQSETILKNQNSIPTSSNQLGIPPPPLPPQLPYPLPTQSQLINSHLPMGAPHNMSNFLGLGPIINPYSRRFQNPVMMIDRTPFHPSGVTVPQLPIPQNIPGSQNVIPSSQHVSAPQNITSSSVQPGNQSNCNQLTNTTFTGVPQGFTLGPNQEPSKDGDSASSQYMQQSSLLGLPTSASVIPFLDDAGPKIPPQTKGESSDSEVKAEAVEPKNAHASSPVDMDMSSPEDDIIERMNEEFWENELKESHNEEPYVPPEFIEDVKSDPTLQLSDGEEDYDPEQFDVTFTSPKKKKKKEKTKKTSDSQPKTKVQSLIDRLHRQARVEEEVKIVVKYYYKHREITKEEYKDILRKAVPQVANSDHSIDPERIRSLVKKYVAKKKGQRILNPYS